MPFPEKPDPNVCPKCGTTDCIPKARVRIQGAGQLSVDSSELTKTCKFRQQMKAARQIVLHTRERNEQRRKD